MRPGLRVNPRAGPPVAAGAPGGGPGGLVQLAGPLEHGLNVALAGDAARLEGAPCVPGAPLGLGQLVNPGGALAGGALEALNLPPDLGGLPFNVLPDVQGV